MLSTSRLAQASSLSTKSRLLNEIGTAEMLNRLVTWSYGRAAYAPIRAIAAD